MQFKNPGYKNRTTDIEKRQVVAIGEVWRRGGMEWKVGVSRVSYLDTK